MTEQIDKYEGVLQIDKHNLDEALMNQAEIYHQISTDYVGATSRRDEAYSEIKDIDSRLYQEIREELIESGEKATEAMVQNAVLAHDEHQVAVQEHLSAKTEADHLGALKEAFHQRSYMLRELVNLYVSGYYTDSAMSYDKDVAKDRQADMNKRKMSEKRRTKRKSLKSRSSE